MVQKYFDNKKKDQANDALDSSVEMLTLRVVSDSTTAYSYAQEVRQSQPGLRLLLKSKVMGNGLSKYLKKRRRNEINVEVFCYLFILVQSVMGASDRYLVESNLTQVAQKTLDAMFGGNFVVNVTVTMIPSRYSVKYTEESNPKKLNKSKSSEEVYILPGVPALKNISPDSLNQLPFDSVTTLVESKIKKVVVVIIKK